MNKKCHWTLSSYLIGEDSWRLRGLALKVGSIMPDVLVHTYIVGHKYDTTADRVEQNLNELKQSGTWTLRNCFLLGYNLHYMEDYFTFPHNSHFEGGFFAHCWYEHKLSVALGKYLRENRRTGQNDGSIYSVLKVDHPEYMKAEPSPENDVAYIVNAAEAVSQEIFDAFSRQSVTPRSRAFMERVGVGAGA